MAAAGQTGSLAPGDLLHTGHRHLANRLAGTGGRAFDPLAEDRTRCRPSRKCGLPSQRATRPAARIAAEALDGGKSVASSEGSAGDALVLDIPDAKLWSPDSPHLYDLKITLMVDGKATDEVRSYFGMRKIEVRKDESGFNRLFLNNEPLFQFGPLDQGYWPDGLYTAPTDEALRYDIEVTKKLGMNMARKHVKIEPARWYYWCDRLGLLVWQDFPAGDKYIGRNDPDIERSRESAENFERELKAMVDTFQNHPSIVMWVPYNEGWGQWETARVCQLIKQWDPTRLVNNASGWTDRGVGDVHDVHSYPGPAMPPVEDRRAAVLGEFGGLGLPIKGHTWQDDKNWGYRSYKNREDLTDAYVALLEKLRPLIGQGLSAAVYTQTSDVEIEVNGLMTYDREMIKMDLARATAAAKKLYVPPPIIRQVVPTSQHAPQSWRYTTDTPSDGWYREDFDDGDWKRGPGGFGRHDTPRRRRANAVGIVRYLDPTDVRAAGGLR